MVTASIVICTHNRAALLGRCVGGALAQAGPAGAEVLVVDNASTDGTARLLDDLVARESPTLRAVREPALGLSLARNRGLREAQGPIVAFLDDDAEPRPGWLAALLASYTSDAVVCVGGPIRLRFSSPPPAWLTADFHGALSAYDLGTEPRRLQDVPSWDYPYGSNVSFRAAAVRAVAGFSPRFGHRGRRQLAHEETDLCMRLDRMGGEIRYAPTAAVDHWVLPERLSPRFFLRRYFERGLSGAVCDVTNRGWRPALRRFRWWDRRHLFVAPHRPHEPIDPARLLAECRRREAMGYLLGLVRSAFVVRRLRREGTHEADAARVGMAAT